MFKGQFLKHKVMAAAKQYSVEKFHQEMNLIKDEDEEAYNWLCEKNPVHWARANFRTTPRCDILLNNLCECFNGNRAILLARQRPILSMLERIRMYLMKRMTKQRLAVEKWHGDIGPRIFKIIEKNKSLSGENIAEWCGDSLYQVTNLHGRMYRIDLALKTCSCGRFQLSGNCHDLELVFIALILFMLLILKFVRYSLCSCNSVHLAKGRATRELH